MIAWTRLGVAMFMIDNVELKTTNTAAMHLVWLITILATAAIVMKDAFS
jgi:hypothetical protein